MTALKKRKRQYQIQILTLTDQNPSKEKTRNQAKELSIPHFFPIPISFLKMDYLKSVVPSQLILEQGSNLVVINPGSANVRIGLASQDAPFNIPHCIARYTTQVPKRNVQDQVLNSQITTVQHMERERAYDVAASLLKIPFLDEKVANNALPRKMVRVDGFNPQNSRKESAFVWTDVYEKNAASSSATDTLVCKGVDNESGGQHQGADSQEPSSNEPKLKQSIYGEEAVRISPAEPYCLRRPIRRGHLNISQHYPMQQVLEDLHAIWDWILIEKLHIPLSKRIKYAAILVVPETFDNREIKEMLSIVLRDLHFSSAVVHQEGLAAVFGNGLSTACVVNIGAQVASVICVEEGELDAVAVVHSYEDKMPAGSHKTRLTALNVPPIGLFYPMLLVPDVYPPPPRSWFHDYEDMLEDTWQMDFPRRTEMPDGLFPNSFNVGFPMWDNYPVFAAKPKKEEKVGLAEAITSSILSTGRIELQRKLFCSIQLIGGVALTAGFVPAVEERVLHAIPSNEAIDTVEVLQSRTNPTFVSWKGGAILGILDFGRDAWIHREDWIRNGIHIGSGRKYKDSYFLQAQAMCYINS
ncbi:actin-related protein 9 isoform X5 [Morus notabilis]|uniref:actin-related protein 9 isoform X5 n=1 Tax=Morus notabilis TaxID=981085 RepID=UPI000CED0CB8|nr:actin-related protein 9 isoform X5 [Morus notabilis]